MRFDTSQQMKLGQQMKLAPRMIQSMEILQLSLPALAERIEQELESNVTLEVVEPGEGAGEDSSVRETGAETTTEGEMQAEGGGEDGFARLDAFESAVPEAFEESQRPERNSSEREYEPSTYSASRMAGERDGKMDAMANAAARGGSLIEQLREQWLLVDVDEELRAPGEMVIASIDDDGYLRVPFEEMLRQAGEAGKGLNVEILGRALLAVQLFLDPPGIGARDARECMLLQVDAIEEDGGGSEVLTCAREMIETHWDDLMHNRLPKVAEQMKISIDRVNEAVEQMRRLRLHPGRELVDERPEVITPDAIVEYDESDDTYFAYLTDARLPNLRVNQEYAKMTKDRDLGQRDKEFIKTNVSNAQWLIDAVNQRKHTLQRVVNVVVEAQRDFFDQGAGALKPLPMTQVADQLGIHVATVSRAVAGKYLQTPRGIFPLRQYFSGGTTTESGEEMSWEAIRAAMQEVVDAEDKRKPLSDEAISKGLKERGIDIARRTVAKYRGQLDIPPARLRKQF
jgi:RNA polymerase sigma-54 factor